MKISLRKSGGVVVLALLLTLTMSITAFAGTITINNPLTNSTYSAYKIFDVTYSGATANPEPTAGVEYSYYSYTIKSNDAWFSDVKSYIMCTINDNGTFTDDDTTDTSNWTVIPTADPNATATAVYGNGLRLEQTSDGETWNVSFDSSTFSAETFAKYLNTKKSGKTATKTASTSNKEDTTLTIADLNAGYYFVTTELGTICMLNTADDAVTINEKNTYPNIGKSTEATSASVGDKVEYTITVGAGSGATGTYVIHDYAIGQSLVLNSSNEFVPTVYLDYKDDSKTDKDLSTGDYTVTTTSTCTAPTGYTCLFELTLNNSILANLVDGDTITITYQATVTNAAINTTDDGTTFGAAKNIANLIEYAANGTTKVEDISTKDTVVNNYDFDIFKYTGDSSSATALADAEFEIYKDAACTSKITFSSGTDSSGNTYYYPNASGTETLKSDSNGLIHIKGLKGYADSSDSTGTTYTIKETKAPAGYNLMTSTKDITLKDADQLYTAGDSGALGSGGVTIVNNTGSEIPETGGMGTTIFYILGGALIVVAGVLLIVRKRTNA